MSHDDKCAYGKGKRIINVSIRFTEQVKKNDQIKDVMW